MYPHSLNTKPARDFTLFSLRSPVPSQPHQTRLLYGLLSSYRFALALVIQVALLCPRYRASLSMPSTVHPSPRGLLLQCKQKNDHLELCQGLKCPSGILGVLLILPGTSDYSNKLSAPRAPGTLRHTAMVPALKSQPGGAPTTQAASTSGSRCGAGAALLICIADATCVAPSSLQLAHITPAGIKPGLY